MKIIAKIFLITTLVCGIQANQAKTEESQLTHNSELNIQESMLDNGLKIIVLNMKTNGVIFGGVGYFVGSGDDPRNVVGISHVLEHMMFKGTKNLSGEDLKKTIFICNKYSNAFTSHDITFYVHMSNKSFLDTDLKIEADRMENLKLNDSDLKKEKEVIIEERKMRTESNPITNYMEEAAWKAMYLFSNYSYPVIGYMDQIKACNQTEVRKHYTEFYKPNNAFVLLVGDISMEEAIKKVQKYFGKIKKGAENKRYRVIDPENTGLNWTMERESEQISVHNLNLIYKINRNLFDDIKKLVTLEIAAGILSSGGSSVLHQNIVDKKELSYDVDSMLDIRAFDKGRLNIATVFRENQNDKHVESEMTSIIDDYAEKYLTKELFEKEKEKTLDQIEMFEDNPQNMGMFILTYIINGYKLKEVKEIKNIIKSITFEDVKALSKQLFTKKNRIMRIYSHPKEN